MANHIKMPIAQSWSTDINPHSLSLFLFSSDHKWNCITVLTDMRNTTIPMIINHTTTKGRKAQNELIWIYFCFHRSVDTRSFFCVLLPLSVNAFGLFFHSFVHTLKLVAYVKLNIVRKTVEKKSRRTGYLVSPHSDTVEKK